MREKKSEPCGIQSRNLIARTNPTKFSFSCLCMPVSREHHSSKSNCLNYCLCCFCIHTWNIVFKYLHLILQHCVISILWNCLPWAAKRLKKQGENFDLIPRIDSCKITPMRSHLDSCKRWLQKWWKITLKLTQPNMAWYSVFSVPLISKYLVPVCVVSLVCWIKALIHMIISLLI